MSTNPNYLVLVQQYGSPGSTTPAISVTAPVPDQVAFDLQSTYEPLLPQSFTNNSFLKVASAGLGVRLAVQSLTAQLWTGSTTGDLHIPLEFYTENDPISDVRNQIVNLMKLVTPSISSSTGMMQSPGPQLDFGQLGTAAKDAAGGAFSSITQVGSAGITAVKNLVTNAFGSSSTNLQPASMIDANSQLPDGTNSTVSKQLTTNPQLGTADYWKSLVTNRISIRVGNYMYFDNVVITGLSQTFISNFDAQTGLPNHVQVGLSFRPMFVLSQADIDQIFINPGANSTPANPTVFTMPGGNTGGVGPNTFGFST